MAGALFRKWAEGRVQVPTWEEIWQTVFVVSVMGILLGIIFAYEVNVFNRRRKNK
jgi:hypothetical protein